MYLQHNFGVGGNNVNSYNKPLKRNVGNKNQPRERNLGYNNQPRRSNVSFLNFFFISVLYYMLLDFSGFTIFLGFLIPNALDCIMYISGHTIINAKTLF